MPSQLHILLLGNGGREHALAHALSPSPLVSSIHCIPGNGGTASLPKTTNVPPTSASASDFSSLVTYALTHGLNFLIPGPEAPLVAGVTDYFAQHAPEVKVYGPSKAAARLEGSKGFSKDFMGRHGIATARYANFTTYSAAEKHLSAVDYRVVIKADGLAAGKGVVIPETKEDGVRALREIMVEREFGDAGDGVVIEEFLEGEELSVISFCDGGEGKSLPAAQDHKRIGEGDTGLNTGGMGTYAPTRIAGREVVERIEREVLRPTLEGARKEGFPFVGTLFTGLMMTKDGPRVLEYNVRFGDPETQSLLALMESDLAEVMVACTEGRLQDVEVKVSDKSAATVVVAAGGYPGSYAKGTVMQLDAVPDDVVLFHAGTTLADNTLKTSGGRVIASTAVADTLEEAVAKAYKGVDCIHFDGMQYRRDIAGRALNK
ncbi:phosphoribosylamine-glycine ligase [Polyplosphaeria fusca]|uniref:phosphoribosylamine--glycine ligase n=1 Tax=Polyplosphaeria fusca TaxID=682080 RepID=A0A9P4QRY7_9PLEO|nr:phosphoribosylamine-glycine ligase [Polyplosphaeria fusca]